MSAMEYLDDLRLVRDEAMFLRGEVERLRMLLAEVEWIGHTMPGGPVEVWHECPVCESVKTDGHADGCRLAEAWCRSEGKGRRWSAALDAETTTTKRRGV